MHRIVNRPNIGLQGPRVGMIFARKFGRIENVAQKVDETVNPILQSGPHYHHIGALAVQLKAVAGPEFKAYARQVVANSRAMAGELTRLGYTLATGGTDKDTIE